MLIRESGCQIERLGLDEYSLLGIKQIPNENLLFNTGNPTQDLPGGFVVKNPPASAGDARDHVIRSLELERSPREGIGTPPGRLQSMQLQRVDPTVGY